MPSAANNNVHLMRENSCMARATPVVAEARRLRTESARFARSGARRVGLAGYRLVRTMIESFMMNPGTAGSRPAAARLPPTTRPRAAVSRTAMV